MPKLMYNCDYCNNQFEKECDAKNCERNHKIIKETKPIYLPNHKYPHKIVVIFEDGNQTHYTDSTSNYQIR